MNENKLIKKTQQANRLKILRESLGLTQAAFGEKIGLSHTKIKDRESGLVKISLPEGKFIEREYGVSSEWLLHGEGSLNTDTSPTGCSMIAEPNADYPSHRISPETSYPDTLVHKTRAVLNSDSVFRRALDSNIEAFHEAVTIKERLANNEARLAQCVDQIELLKNEIEQLKGAQAKKAV